MNSKLLLIKFTNLSIELEEHLRIGLSNKNYEFYDFKERCSNRKIIFVMELNELGYNMEFISWLTLISNDKSFFENSVAGLIIKSNSELYTKRMAQDILFHTNLMGLSFIGHSVVEMTKNYINFDTWQKIVKKSKKEIATDNCVDLIDRIYNYKRDIIKNKKILALHSSSYEKSNTLALWHLIRKKLEVLNCENIDEIHIENGTIVDCKGCEFQTCLHYGEQHSCFYGGLMVKEILPSIENSDVIVWICPNYNDSISSSMIAVINRLTVLYRQISFKNKAFYAVVVSGSSGSDSLSRQLIGALNINKGFFLPPYFSIMEISNDPLKVLKLEGIDKRAKDMAEKIDLLYK